MFHDSDLLGFHATNNSLTSGPQGKNTSVLVGSYVFWSFLFFNVSLLKKNNQQQESSPKIRENVEDYLIGGVFKIA